MSTHASYAMMVRRDPELGYVAYFNEVGSVTGSGATREEAVRAAEAAMGLYVVASGALPPPADARFRDDAPAAKAD